MKIFFIKKFLEKSLLINGSLGLCSLLSIATLNIINSLALGIVITTVMLLTNVIVSMLKKIIPYNIRIPIYMMIIVSVTLFIELIINNYYVTLYNSIGFFISMTITNCIILNRADNYASKNGIFNSIFDSFSLGLTLLLLLFIMGGLREFFGHGTLFSNDYTFLKKISDICYIKFDNFYFHVLLIELPAGASILLGFVLAVKKLIDKKIHNFIKNKYINIKILNSN